MDSRFAHISVYSQSVCDDGGGGGVCGGVGGGAQNGGFKEYTA